MLNDQQTTIEIGGMAIRLRARDPQFLAMLRARYSGFVRDEVNPQYEFEVDLNPTGKTAEDEDLQVRMENDRWQLTRGDFHAEWAQNSKRGRIRQSANPYSVDAVLRIVHSLILAEQGGFLLHGAGAIRNGRAFLFSGVSTAGKTTISRLAPADVTLLTDEISYIRREGDTYVGFGTPFSGELEKAGPNVSAPIANLYLLGKGPENRIEPVAQSDAVRLILRNVLFFAQDPELVGKIVHSVRNFVERVPISRLIFYPDQRVWDLIR